MLLELPLVFDTKIDLTIAVVASGTVNTTAGVAAISVSSNLLYAFPII